MASAGYLPLHEPGTPVDRDNIISAYFQFGFSYSDIIVFLSLYHNIELSLRHLCRILRKLGLRRRKGKDSIGTIYQLIERELCGTGRDLGYRSMHERLVKIHRAITDRETVRLVLLSVDPKGVQLRRRHRLHRRLYNVPGPSFLWHIDGWDKLKQFGFSIHGCIDGYSRRIMWLEVAATNKDPYVVCRYFADIVRQIKGVPKIIRADRGTENVNIETMQLYLRSAHQDQRVLHTSFMYGRSTANQRIECWWSKFRQNGMDFWISHFKEMSELGIIDTSNELNIQCCRFCYMHLLQKELHDILKLWNTHYIRMSRNENVPHGRPDVIYYMPEVFGGRDFLCQVDDLEVAALSELLSSTPPTCEGEYAELFELLMLETNLVQPSTLEEADALFVYLLDKVDDYVAQM